MRTELFMSTRIVWVALGAGVVALAAYVTLRDVKLAEPQVKVLAPAATDHVSEQAVPTSMPSQAPLATKSVQATPTGQVDLLAMYNSGVSIRTFVGEALKHPERGGYLYAREAFKTCQVLAMTVRTTSSEVFSSDSEASKKAKAREAVERRCSEFVDAEYSDSSQADLRRQAMANGDTLFASIDRFAAANERNDRPAAIAEALRTRDPLVLQDVGDRLSAVSTAQGIGYYFQGKTYLVKDDPPIAYALSLIPCGLGLECGTNDPLTAHRCISGQGCDASRFAYAERLLSARGDGTYREAMVLYEKMVASIKAGAVNDWVPK